MSNLPITTHVFAFLTRIFTVPKPFEFTSPHSIGECKVLLENLNEHKQDYGRMYVNVTCETTHLCAFQIRQMGIRIGRGTANLEILGKMEETAPQITYIQGHITFDAFIGVFIGVGGLLFMVVGIAVIDSNSIWNAILSTIPFCCAILALGAIAYAHCQRRETTLLDHIKATLLTP